jgi:two-component system sensor histidine kinase AlgZ
MHSAFYRSTVASPWRASTQVRRVHFVYWTMQLGAWGWFFWWQASGEAIFASVPLAKAATVWGGICLTGIALTDLLRRVSERSSWPELPASALMVRLIVGVLTLSAITFIVTVALSLAVYGSPIVALYQAFYWKLPPFYRLSNEFLRLFLVDLTWTAAYFSITLILRRYHIELRQKRLSEALQAAELQLLKSQLNPHFLFNTLNSVRALIADEPSRAQDAVTQLARMLRYMLASSAEELVTLGGELEMVEDYLALEKSRLAERLHIVREIERDATSVRIPVLLLQALAENAIKHGIAALKEGGTLRIAARLVGSELWIDVENPRPPAVVRESVTGVGLKNAARRLQLLFGERASLRLDLSDPHRAIASARIPI